MSRRLSPRRPWRLRARSGASNHHTFAARQSPLPCWQGRACRAATVAACRQQAYVAALRQYPQRLAGAALVEGVDLDAAATPLVQ
jgi:hypothetical protein